MNHATYSFKETKKISPVFNYAVSEIESYSVEIYLNNLSHDQVERLRKFVEAMCRG